MKPPKNTQMEGFNPLQGYKITGFYIVLIKPASVASDADKEAKIYVKLEDKEGLKNLRNIIEEFISK